MLQGTQVTNKSKHKIGKYRDFWSQFLMVVLGAHTADEPKAASVMPSPLEGLNWTMVDHSYCDYSV